MLSWLESNSQTISGVDEYAWKASSSKGSIGRCVARDLEGYSRVTVVSITRLLTRGILGEKEE